ncbi:MAG: hypothetical protein ACREEY_15525 [Brevundimonas sp.]
MEWIQHVIEWLDPDWFQAIASVFAICAGFIYVALEQSWSRRREKALQAAMRIHAKLLCDDILKWQTAVLSVFRASNATGTPTTQHFPPKPLTAIAMELMTMPVADLGDPSLASLARHIGASTIGFIEEAQQSGGTVCATDVLKRMEALAGNTTNLVEQLKVKSEA